MAAAAVSAPVPSPPDGERSAYGPFAPTAAQAHSQLVSSVPADGASVERVPQSVSLTFNEEINPNFAQAVLVGVDGEPRRADTATAGTTVTVTTPGGLAAGRVAVRYRVVSKDGHPIEGEISFTAATGSPGAAPSVAGSGGASAAATGGPGATPSVAPAKADDGMGFSPWGYPLVGSAALILIGIGLALRKRPRREA